MKILARGVGHCGHGYATAGIGVRFGNSQRAEKVVTWIISTDGDVTLCWVNPNAAGLTEAILPSREHRKELDLRARCQAEGGGTRENGGRDDAKSSRDGGHGLGFSAKKNCREENCEQHERHENFHRIPLRPIVPGNSGECNWGSKTLLNLFLYLRCTCPLGHRKFGMQKVNVA